MKNFFSKVKNIIKENIFILFAAIALILPEIALMGLISPKIFTENYVGIVTKIFTASWVFIIIYISAFFFSKKWGKVIYIVTTSVFIIFAFCEYVYYKIFEQFFWVRNIALAGEGKDYFGYAIKLIDAKVLLYSAVALIFMILAAIFWKSKKEKGMGKVLCLLIPIIVLIGTHIYMQPELHNDPMDQWDTWRKPRVVYKNFNDVNKSFEASGLYQFTYRNIADIIFPESTLGKKDYEKIEEFFDTKGKSSENEFTGMFKGKNVIAVMMESVDTWMIDKENTPTLYNMMKNGITFTNYNAPFFGVGFTFSSEFAFNTGYFTPVAAVSASNFSTNKFPYSLARLFDAEGYTANSFHFNDASFYNRGIMHKSFGYEKYHSVKDFGLEGLEAELDSNMIKNDDIYNKMTANQPFYNFIITYSAHLPYKGEGGKLSLAKEYYPDAIIEGENEEVNNVRVLVKDTDEFFRILIERLEEDGLMDDTVIVAYTDHFAYGVSDQNLLNELKGDTLSYTVPAFIYAKNIKPMKINKPMMTIDWAPTLVNLFGLSRNGSYIGNDILDPTNNGFVYFETWAWMDENMMFNPSKDDATLYDLSYIEKQNKRVRESIGVNDAIVMGDYYAVK